MRNVYCGICGTEHKADKAVPFTLKLTCVSCGAETHIECDSDQITAINFYAEED